MSAAQVVTGDGVSSDATPASRTLQLTPASAIKPRPVTWLWNDRIPSGAITLTPGAGGIGKSTFHAWTIAQVTTGKLAGLHAGKPKAAIVCAGEDSLERTIVPRLIAAGAKLDSVYRVEAIKGGESVMLSLPADIDALAKQIESRNVAVVSLDPLMSLLSGTIDSHKDAEVRRAIEPLSRLADLTGCAILGNAHFNKSGGTDPTMRITGSAAFGQVVRSVLAFAADPETGDCVITQSKNNLGPLDLPSLAYRIESFEVPTDEGAAHVGRLVFVGDSARSVRDILGDQEGVEERSGLHEATEWLCSVLEDGPIQKSEVRIYASSEGISDRTLDRAQRALNLVSTRDATAQGRPATWALPEYAPNVTRPSALARKNQVATTEVEAADSVLSRQSLTLARNPPPDVGAQWSNDRLEALHHRIKGARDLQDLYEALGDADKSCFRGDVSQDEVAGLLETAAQESQILPEHAPTCEL